MNCECCIAESLIEISLDNALYDLEQSYFEGGENL